MANRSLRSSSSSCLVPAHRSGKRHPTFASVFLAGSGVGVGIIVFFCVCVCGCKSAAGISACRGDDRWRRLPVHMTAPKSQLLKWCSSSIDSTTIGDVEWLVQEMGGEGNKSVFLFLSGFLFFLGGWSFIKGAGAGLQGRAAPLEFMRCQRGERIQKG